MRTTAEASIAALQWVYADDAMVVVNKPSGLLSVPGRGADKQDCVSSRVQQLFPDALIVHRLDMATSGLMVMARGLHAQQTINLAFTQRQIHKRYTAEVAGVLPVRDTWQEINLAIAADWPRRPLRIIDPVYGKPSLTRWRCINTDPQRGVSRLELEPITGRNHQLRVHLQALGHPILGDALYAPSHIEALSPRLHLHATVLQLTHPAHGNRITFNAPPDF